MKLRNKKTGEILESARSSAVIKDKFRIYDELNDKYYTYNSLAELNEEWEDYEEPKSWWYIDCNGEVFRGENADKEHTDEHKSIGNYYTSSKEAEEAVEKLKAWKRLKDKGFVFKGINVDDGSIKTGLSKDVPLNDCEEFYCDIKLLFGGEE